MPAHAPAGGVGLAVRATFAAGIALGGFLACRRGFEVLTEVLREHGAAGGSAAAVAGLPYIAVTAGLALVALRLAAAGGLVDRLPVSGALPQLLAGCCLGAAFVAVTLAVELAVGLAGLTGASRPVPMRGLAAGLVDLGAIAVAEELVFRLALLAALARLTSWPVAVLLSSAAYAAVHASRGRLWPVYLIGLACFGVVACQLFAARRSLWLPIGAHWAWDFASFTAFLVLPLRLRGPAWLSGLPDQLSAGLVMLLVLALAAAALTWHAIRSAQTRRDNPEVRSVRRPHPR